MKYHIVEKKNNLAVHAHCDTLESAKRYLAVTVPKHCKLGYYTDKTLKPSDFEIKQIN